MGRIAPFFRDVPAQDGILAIERAGSLEAASFHVLTDQTRYRLTGLVFLVAVAAIFLPMLFDGDGVEPMQLDPLPAADFKVERDVDPPPDMAPVIAAREELSSAIDEDGYATDTGTRFGNAVLLDDNAVVGADLKWAVQLASFSQVENADRLIARLRADGYAAFVSHARRDGERIARVAVGPVVERDAASRLKAELNRRYEFGAVVVRFSP